MIFNDIRYKLIDCYNLVNNEDFGGSIIEPDILINFEDTGYVEVHTATNEHLFILLKCYQLINDDFGGSVIKPHYMKDGNSRNLYWIEPAHWSMFSI